MSLPADGYSQPFPLISLGWPCHFALLLSRMAACHASLQARGLVLGLPQRSHTHASAPHPPRAVVTAGSAPSASLVSPVGSVQRGSVVWCNQVNTFSSSWELLLVLASVNLGFGEWTVSLSHPEPCEWRRRTQPTGLCGGSMWHGLGVSPFCPPRHPQLSGHRTRLRDRLSRAVDVIDPLPLRSEWLLRSPFRPEPQYLE